MHSSLIEEIRNKLRHLSALNWTIHFGWVKAHTGIEGNEAADKLAKEAAHDEEDQIIVYDRISATTIATEINMQGLIKWQSQWNSTEKGALCQSFFPVVEQRLKMKIPIAPEFTAIVTGHRKTKSYLHRFKLADNPTCPCNEGAQTPKHIIYECKILESQRSSLIQHVAARGGNWPPTTWPPTNWPSTNWAPTNDELVVSYLNAFSKFIKSIDFQKLN
jgi:hypothetical protein